MTSPPVYEGENSPELSSESFFSTLDLVLLALLLAAAVWYVLRRNRQDDLPPATKSYSIQ